MLRPRALPVGALMGVLLAGLVAGPAAAVPPTAAMDVLGTVQVVKPFAVSWTGTPGDAPITGYDVRYRRAAWNGTFGSFTMWKSNVPELRAAFSGAMGYTYCFSVRARDGVGPVGVWSVQRCTSVPLDDRALERSAGWVLAGMPIDYRGTILRSSTGGAWLRLTGVKARRIYLVIREPVDGGLLRVYWRGKFIGTQDLGADPPEVRDVHPAVNLPAVETGTLEFRVVGGTGPVRIDGVAIRR